MTISFLILTFFGLLNFGRIGGTAASLGKIIETKRLFHGGSTIDAFREISQIICEHFDQPLEEFKSKLFDLSKNNKFVKSVLEEKTPSGVQSIELLESRGLLYCMANFLDKKWFKNLHTQIKILAAERYPKIYNFIKVLPKLKGLGGRIEPVGQVLLSAYFGESLDTPHLGIILNLEDKERKLLGKWQMELYGKNIYPELGNPKFKNPVALMEILRNLQFRPCHLELTRRNTVNY